MKYNQLFKKNIKSLKPQQVAGLKAVIRAVKEGSHDMIFLLLRTGYGKTVIVDLARLSLDCVLLGVYPLDSIMIPSQQRYVDAGLTSIIIDETFVRQVIDFQGGCEVLNESVKTRVSLFLTAQVSAIHGHPEALMSKTILKVLKSEPWTSPRILIFEDEGHLEVKWGAEYRPSYSKLYRIREAFATSQNGLPTIVVASATCPESMRKQIVSLHNIPDDRTVTVKTDPGRPNIFIRVKPAATTFTVPFSDVSAESPRRTCLRKELKPIIREFKSDSFRKTIIIFNKKELCGEIYELFELEVGPISDSSIVQLHADLGRELKEFTFNSILSGKVKLILATESAGTGADFPGFTVINFPLKY